MKDFFKDFFWDGDWIDRLFGTFLLLCVLALTAIVVSLIYVCATDKHFHYMATKVEYMEAASHNNEFCQVNPNEDIIFTPTYRIDSCVLCHEVYKKNIGYDFRPTSKYTYNSFSQNKWKMPKKPKTLSPSPYFPVYYPLYVKTGNPIYLSLSFN